MAAAAAHLQRHQMLVAAAARGCLVRGVLRREQHKVLLGLIMDQRATLAARLFKAAVQAAALVLHPRPVLLEGQHHLVLAAVARAAANQQLRHILAVPLVVHPVTLQVAQPELLVEH